MEYRASLFRWITETKVDKFVIADASNTSIINNYFYNLAKLYGKTIQEFIFDFSDVSRKFGKGRSEAMLTNSIIPGLSNDDIIYKITGRLFLKNHNILITEKNESIFGPESNNKTDTRFWKTTKQYYLNNLTKLINRINDYNNICIEMIYPRVGNFVQYPIFIGRSGTSGVVYSEMLDLKSPVKSLVLRTRIPLKNFRITPKHDLRSFKY
jgi:hypothetical protein